ncbi:hypothetical protein FEE96_19055 [Parasedimentitalea maritima]|uniref:Uncharacterized protein n=1 Tax=Parasedimentitalea maritima TaxID=2578117 RepID=A0ABY2UPY4_9RHOB|nr:hypothetical protein [Zongyanglinia marina]TLP57486.1 hypothetical protein FEE96_19055 [Zongyanglinia marina]
MKVDELKLELNAALGTTQVASLCVQLIDQLVHLDDAHGQMLTYTSLQKLLNYPEIDTPLVSAVHFLTSSRYALLEAHGQLIDDDGDEYPLEDVDFNEVLKSGFLVHPGTGEIVIDAKDKVMPYFALSLPKGLEWAPK